MTDEQLEELLWMLDNGHPLDAGRAMDELVCLAPSLARRALAAERLVEALNMFVIHYPRGINPDLDDAAINARAALTAYRAARGAITRGTPPAFATSA